MRKIHEIQKELSVEIENYKQFQGEGKTEEAEGALGKVRVLTAELNEARTIDAAERAAAENDFSRKEKKELQQFSFRKFLREASDGNLTGFEKEMSEEALREARENAINLNGLGIPFRVLSARAAGQNVTTPADGGGLVENAPLTYIELLRNRLVLRELGAIFMTGLRGNIPFVKGSKVAVSWVSEAENKEDVQKMKFSQEEMKPKRLIMTTAYTKDLLNQASMDIERLLMDEMVLAHAQAIEDAALNGSGDKEPKGILNLTGIGSVVLGENGGNLSWKSVVDLETAISAKNADLGNLAYLTNSKVRGTLKTTEKSAGTAKYVMERESELNGYKLGVTNLMPSDITKGTGTKLSSMIFGNFSDLLIGQWGGLDIVVDPYTKKKSAEIEVTINAWHDVFVKNDESFAAIKDIITG